MGDEELQELAADFSDLTPTAQQILRDEMRLRKLGDPQWERPAAQVPHAAKQAQSADSFLGRAAMALGTRRPEPVPNTPASQSPSAGPVEYTWKTPLCNCESDEQAWQISEVLKRAGIESWIESASTYANSSGSQHIAVDEGNRRVLVAADQLDQALEIAAQPIPQEIVEQSKVGPPEYEPPACPKCGAADPILEDIDPVNAWKCEVCGAEWSDAPREAGEGTESGV